MNVRGVAHGDKTTLDSAVSLLRFYIFKPVLFQALTSFPAAVDREEKKNFDNDNDLYTSCPATYGRQAQLASSW